MISRLELGVLRAHNGGIRLNHKDLRRDAEENAASIFDLGSSGIPCGV